MKKYSKELKRKRLEKKIKRIFFFYFTPAILLFSLFVFAFNSESVSLQKIFLTLEKNKKTNYLEKNKIFIEINSILDGRYFSIFSKRNSLFFPEDEILLKLKKKFPEIEKINLKRGHSFRDLEIQILEEKPEFIYCQSEKLEKCFLMNSTGKIFYKIENFKKEKNNIIFISEKEKKIAENFFDSKKEREKILKFLDRLKKINKLKIKFFEKKNKYLYKLVLNDNTKIILASDFKLDDIGQKIDKITKLKEFKVFEGGFNSRISYINLSLKKRIAYCLKSDICEKNY
jgi:hypothetical protein